MKGLCVLGVTGALALAPGSAQIFRSGTAVVRVDVLVTEHGYPVTGLTSADFELRDNGVLQRIDSVTVDTVGVSLMLALDASTSVDGYTLQWLKAAAQSAIDALRDTDRVALLTFGGAVFLRADWGATKGSVRDAVANVRASGTTSLYDGTFAALTLRDSAPGNRAFIVLFSDGVDTASWLPARAVLEIAKRTDAVVYSVMRRQPRHESRLEYRSGVRLWPSSGAPPNPFVVELAELTGGDTFVAPGANKLQEVFSGITAQFRSRYLIMYTPLGVDATGWHPIHVRLKERSGTVRARRGYIR